MNWFRIEKELTEHPTSGTYKDWKEPLAIEGKYQCVYCTIKSRSFGGIRNFHVEHYKPKSSDKFPELINDFSNLFFACSICNGFKSNDWPNEPNDDFDIDCYPNPSKIDYSILFSINTNFELESKYVTGRYIIEKLFLNRDQLILERKEYSLKKKKINIILEIGELALNINDKFVQKIILTLIQSLINELHSFLVNPYTLKQITRGKLVKKVQNIKKEKIAKQVKIVKKVKGN